MEGLRPSSPLIRLLAADGVFSSDPFVVLDVGCSGGIDVIWREFGPALVAHAFDPVVSECERLQKAEPHPGVKFHGKFVGLPPTHEFARRRREEEAKAPNANPWNRLSCAGFYKQPVVPEAAPSPTRKMADPEKDLVGVTEFVRQERLGSVDFLKVDVDGTDIEVLVSAADMLSDTRVLGVGVEVNWYGGAHPTANTFHNMDRFLRERGFSLFSITQRPYSRAALPGPFQYELAAQTAFGQPYQGDAAYLRDLADPANVGLSYTYPPTKLLKLACLFDAFGLPDCAAEVLVTFRTRIASVTDPDRLLDALVPPLHGQRLSYKEYMRQFATRPETFFPSYRPPAEAAPPPVGPEPIPQPVVGGVIGPVPTSPPLIRRALRKIKRMIRKPAA